MANQPAIPRLQPPDHFGIRGHQDAGPFVLLAAAEGLIQRQFRRVGRLNRLDVQVRSAGIKARNSGNEKRR